MSVQPACRRTSEWCNVVLLLARWLKNLPTFLPFFDISHLINSFWEKNEPLSFWSLYSKLNSMNVRGWWKQNLKYHSLCKEIKIFSTNTIYFQVPMFGNSSGKYTFFVSKLLTFHSVLYRKSIWPSSENITTSQPNKQVSDSSTTYILFYILIRDGKKNIKWLLFLEGHIRLAISQPIDHKMQLSQINSILTRFQISCVGNRSASQPFRSGPVPRPGHGAKAWCGPLAQIIWLFSPSAQCYPQCHGTLDNWCWTWLEDRKLHLPPNR